uniref:Uncharacterized protein n=1 Tax=Oryza punctata TaxID=4537 RepID=A0A0E0KH96_ORYPU
MVEGSAQGIHTGKVVQEATQWPGSMWRPWCVRFRHGGLRDYHVRSATWQGNDDEHLPHQIANVGPIESLDYEHYSGAVLTIYYHIWCVVVIRLFENVGEVETVENLCL